MLGVWLEAIADGERDIGRALREIRPALLRLPQPEQQQVGWEFVLAALKITPRKARKVRGMPTSWRKTNRELVDFVAKVEHLGKTNADQYDNSVFKRVADLWTDWGIATTPRQVMDGYHKTSS